MSAVTNLQLAHLTGVVSKVAGAGFQVHGSDTWHNLPKFGARPAALPAVGQRVEFDVDDRGFVRALTADGVAAGAAPSSSAPALTGAVAIRAAALAAAAAFLGPRLEAHAPDVIKTAACFARWIETGE